MSEVVCSTIERIEKLGQSTLKGERLIQMEEELKTQAQEALRNGRWKIDFRGRDILRRFSNRQDKSLNYEIFRDLILAKMKDASFQPPGMANVVHRILQA